MNLCQVCAIEATQRCERCRAVFYCTKEHQTEHWKIHKKTCVVGGRDKFSSTGFPLYRDDSQKPAAVESRRFQHMQLSNDIAGIGQAQQSMMEERLEAYTSACDGNFVVLDAVSGSQYMSNDIRDCTKVVIEWSNKRKLQSFVRMESDVLFLSPASLVMEMISMTDGKLDKNFKYLEGGLLYLIGEPHLFWSMMIHRKAKGMCFPPQPDTQRTWSWAQTWAVQEMERLNGPVVAARGQSMLSSLNVKSRSLSALVLFDNLRSPDSARAATLKFVAAAMSNEDHLMTNLPSWWTECETLWSGVIDRAWRRSPPTAACMFFCTPVGCMAGTSSCIAFHDEQYKNEITKIKTRKY